MRPGFGNGALAASIFRLLQQIFLHTLDDMGKPSEIGKRFAGAGMATTADGYQQKRQIR
jgi:hypothetical protein